MFFEAKLDLGKIADKSIYTSEFWWINILKVVTRIDRKAFIFVILCLETLTEK